MIEVLKNYSFINGDESVSIPIDIIIVTDRSDLFIGRKGIPYLFSKELSKIGYRGLKGCNECDVILIGNGCGILKDNGDKDNICSINSIKKYSNLNIENKFHFKLYDGTNEITISLYLSNIIKRCYGK